MELNKSVARRMLLLHSTVIDRSLLTFGKARERRICIGILSASCFYGSLCCAVWQTKHCPFLLLSFWLVLLPFASRSSFVILDCKSLIHM